MIRYQITDGTAALDERGWLARLRPDVEFIQIRERELSVRDLARLLRVVLDSVPGPRVLVNDRADVALACGAAGVHLRAGSVQPETLRRLGQMIVTVACHDLGELESVQGADYVLVSPVFRPLSKADSRTPLGLHGLKRFAEQSRVPVLALGGIEEANAPQCIAAGAAGVAGITCFGDIRLSKS